MKRSSPLVAAMTFLCAASLGVTALGTDTTHANAPSGDVSSVWCDGPDLVLALSDLDTGPRLVVSRDASRLTLFDPVSGVTLLQATCGGLEIAGLDSVERPGPRLPARTVSVRHQGERAYSHSVTSRGARVTVIEPGHVNDTGLHVIAFDNDDVHVTDGLGRLLYSRTTTPEGALIVREGAGCQCEQETSPDGVVTNRAL